jgi:hypothetical protein
MYFGNCRTIRAEVFVRSQRIAQEGTTFNRAAGQKAQEELKLRTGFDRAGDLRG